MYRKIEPQDLDGRKKRVRMGYLFREGNTSSRRCNGRVPGWQALLSLICALSCSGPSNAETAWSVTPSVRVEGSHDDNASLNATTPNSVTGRRLSTAVGLTRIQSSGEIRGVLGADFLDYTGNNAPPEDGNQIILLSGIQRARRSTWHLNATLKRDSLLRTVELPPIADADVPIGDIDVALVTIPIRRDRLWLNPSWTYDLTRLADLRLSYALTTEQFEETAGGNVVDYNTHALTAGLGHRLSPKNRVSANVRVQRFEPEDRESADTYELLANLTHSYSPVGTVGVELGTRRVTRADTETDHTGFVAGLSWGGQSPVGTTLMKLERRLYSNGFGDLAETDQIVAQWTRQLSRTTQLLMRGRAFETNPISSDSPNDREYAQLGAEIRHSLDHWWSVGIAYRYRWTNRESDPESAESNGIFISIGYDDKPIMLE